jgi:hypothetical protein
MSRTLRSLSFCERCVFFFTCVCMCVPSRDPIGRQPTASRRQTHVKNYHFPEWSGISHDSPRGRQSTFILTLAPTQCFKSLSSYLPTACVLVIQNLLNKPVFFASLQYWCTSEEIFEVMKTFKMNG